MFFNHSMVIFYSVKDYMKMELNSQVDGILGLTIMISNLSDGLLNV